MATTVFPIVLDRKNYDDWSCRVKTYLLAEDLWDVLGIGTVESPKTKDGKSKAWKKKDAKALYAIQNSCEDDTYQLIKSASTAKEAWHTLLTTLKPYEPPDEIETVLEAYPPVDDTRPQSLLEAGRNGERDESNDNDIHKTFSGYVKSNDWDNAIKFLRLNPGKGIEKLFGDDAAEDVTVLHYAIRNFKSCSVRIIEQLVKLMENEVLEVTDDFGYTSFYHVVEYCPERVEVAECMVKKNPKLLTILPSGEPPVVLAQGKTKGERMARYLYSLTSHETLKVSHAAQLISLGFDYNRFDIAWDLIQRYPKLAMAKDSNGDIPLVKLAMNRFAFKSGSRLSLWEKLIYYGIRIKPLPPKDRSRIVEKPENDQSDQRHLSDQKENQRHLIFSGVTRIYQMKLMHERVKQFLPCMCKAVPMVGRNYYKINKLDAALCMATERGHVEYITHVHRDATYPIHNVRNEKGQNLLQIAVECRHHEVYNLLYDVNQLRKKENILGPDNFGNNMLHTVASITPLSQIDHIQGAALQMQRELQWFKEVESIVDPQHCESENKNNKTPRQVFTENHKELGKEAEKSLKETATSCTVVGALIVTIMFAAAFTVPGENDEEDKKRGLPTFLTNKVFTTFIVSDAISLFSSTTSVIMFLGILTSRYSEADFHKSLPTKMIIGLFTLFLSIATMMIVFSCGLYIMLDGKSSIVIPSILLASVPVTSFIWMQFPLLVELFISTFGRGIFERKRKNLF